LKYLTSIKISGQVYDNSYFTTLIWKVTMNFALTEIKRTHWRPRLHARVLTAT